MSYYTTHTGRQVKGSIVKEDTYGTVKTTTLPLSITGPSIEKDHQMAEDPRFIGQNFTTAQIKVGEIVKGSLPLTAHPKEVGLISYLTLMKELTPVAAAQAFLLIYYVGTDAYADVEKAAASIVGSSGAAVGSKVTKWTFDTSSGSYDTLTELAAAINAADSSKWIAYGFGLQTALTSLLGTISVTPIYSGNCIILPLTSASTTAYLHKIKPAAPADTDKSFTYCEDHTIGSTNSISYSGCKINGLKIDIPPKAIVKIAADVIGKVETLNITYPSLTIPMDSPYFGSSGRFLMGKLETTLAKTLNIDIAMGLDTEFTVGTVNANGYGAIIEPIRAGAGTCRVKLTAALLFDSTAWAANYAALDANTNEEIIIYLENVGYADQTNNCKYSILMRIPSMTFLKYASPATGPGRIIANVDGESVYNINYDNIEIWIQDTTTAY